MDDYPWGEDVKHSLGISLTSILREVSMPVVTIQGRAGSGASEIGWEIARKNRVEYIDRGIIAKVASRLQWQESEVKAKEIPPVGL